MNINAKHPEAEIGDFLEGNVSQNLFSLKLLKREHLFREKTVRYKRINDNILRLMARYVGGAPRPGGLTGSDFLEQPVVFIWLVTGGGCGRNFCWTYPKPIKIMSQSYQRSFFIFFSAANMTRGINFEDQ